MPRLIANITKTWLMERIESIDKIRQLTTETRAKGKGFLTNFYLDEFKHSIWIGKGSLLYEWIVDTCFLFRRTSNYWNAFYMTPSLEDLDHSLFEVGRKYNEYSLIFDVVGRQEKCSVVIPVFKQNGFFEENSLVRFIRINTPIELDQEIALVKRASLEQTHLVHHLLHQYMDERVEQIPEIEEYEQWGKLGHILVYYVNDEIAGFFDYEKNVTTTHTRHWLVHPKFRGRHIGSVLFRRFLYEANDTKRILSWVIRSNDISIQNHYHYGFRMENMFDYIMTNNKQ